MALATEPGASSVVSQGRPKQPGVIKRIFRKKITIIAVGFLIIVALAAIFAPIVAPYKLNSPDLNAMLAPPSSAHLMGTDDVGIDLFTEVL